MHYSNRICAYGVNSAEFVSFEICNSIQSDINLVICESFRINAACVKGMKLFIYSVLIQFAMKPLLLTALSSIRVFKYQSRGVPFYVIVTRVWGIINQKES